MSVNMQALTAAVQSNVAQVKAQSVAVKDAAVSGVQAVASISEIRPLDNPARAVAQVGSAILGAANLGAELTNVGVAALTSPIAAAMPAFPAAHLGSLYLGIPHAHLHPPSVVPPSPVPVPLPSIGAITLGTSLQVLVGGLPAARVGDLGLAPTCGGFAPFFTVFMGSSKVFFGGTRAARQSDMCTACTPSTAGVARGLAKAMEVAGKTVAMASIAASAIDAVHAAQAADEAASPHDAAEQAAAAAANAVNAAAASAQMAADAAATALSATMGMDPAVPPGMVGFVTQGAGHVLVGGMPMPNLPDPAQWLLKKMKRKLKKLAAKHDRGKVGGGGGCAG